METYQLLEKEIVAWTGVPNVAVCSSGTAALHLAIEALQIPQGSKIAVPDFCMIAVPRAVIMAGMSPVMITPDETFNMDLDALDEALQVGDISAIIVVHTYGRQAPMKEVHALANKYGVKVIEDLAEAHGVPQHPRTFAGCYSFYRNKLVGGEEGGCVVSPAPGPVDLVRQLRCLGFTQRHDFYHIPRGMNYRMPNCCADLIRTSLQRINIHTMERNDQISRYDEQCPPEWRLPERDSPWVYDFRVPDMDHSLQDSIVSGLNRLGIHARHAFKPVHLQQEFKARRVHGDRKFSCEVAREVVYLPLTGNGTINPFEVTQGLICAHEVHSA